MGATRRVAPVGHDSQEKMPGIRTHRRGYERAALLFGGGERFELTNTQLPFSSRPYTGGMAGHTPAAQANVSSSDLW